MKKSLLSIVMALALLLSLAVPAYAADTFCFTLETDVEAVEVGDIVTVTLVASASHNSYFEIYIMQNYIGFDADVFEYVEGSLGVYHDESDTAMFRATVQKDEIFVNCAHTLTPVTFAGSGEIMSFQLRAKAVGETELTHNHVELVDNHFNSYTVETVNASVEIVEEGTLPDDGGSQAPGSSVDANRRYSIDFPEEFENGTADISTTQAKPNSVITIYAEPDEGYEVDEINVTRVTSGESVEVGVNEDGDYVFMMPRGNVEVEVTFKEIEGVDDPVTPPTDPEDPEDPEEPEDPADPEDTADPEDPVDPAPGEHDCPSAAYSDIDTAKWYHEACDYVIENDIMNGYPDNTFAPDAATSRAMIATMIWRLAGEPSVSVKESPFTDVAPDAWYYDAVCWASENGIVNGYGNGIFAPDDLITREQFAAMIYRYEQSQGGGFTGSWMFLLDFTDRADVSDWAYEAVCWCTMNKVINGMGDGTLLPKGNATRAHAAQILMNYITME